MKPFEIVEIATGHLGDSARISFDFFAVFARFEFALKKSGFATGGDVSADWERFATTSEIKAAFREVTNERVREAISFLVANPPAKQVLSDGTLNWRQVAPQGHPQRAKNVFQMVARVRNNLFHGGKFRSGPVDDPARNDALLTHCPRLRVVERAARRKARVQERVSELFPSP